MQFSMSPQAAATVLQSQSMMIVTALFCLTISFIHFKESYKLRVKNREADHTEAQFDTFENDTHGTGYLLGAAFCVYRFFQLRKEDESPASFNP